MVKKIVAIGGGENGRINSQGIQKPYETREIDEEMKQDLVKLLE